MSGQPFLCGSVPCCLDAEMPIMLPVLPTELNWEEQAAPVCSLES